MSATRRIIQAAAALAANAHLAFPFTKNIYQGRLKVLCSPGLNCYSCPAAVVSCPIGALQQILAGVRPAVEASIFHLGLYAAGFLGLIGSLAGRMPCGWLCPFGFFQDLLYKLPLPHVSVPKALTRIKYVLLAVFVVMLPLMAVDEFGFGSTWYCKYICPAGTLEAGIPLLLLQPDLRNLVDWLFFLKVTIMAGFLGWMTVSSRPFCKTACPLGAVYALFNRHSVFRLVHNPENCTLCGACYEDCPMDVRFYEQANHTECIRCLKCMTESCRFDAITWEIAGQAESPAPFFRGGT